MNKSSLIIGIVVVSVAIILTATVLVPVLDDAKKGYETESFDNPSGFGSEKVTDAAISVDVSTSTLTMDGESWAVSGGKIPMFMAENYLFQINSGSLGSNDLVYCDENGPVRVTVKEMELALSNKTITLNYTDSDDNEVSTTIPCNWAYKVTGVDSAKYQLYNLYGTSKAVYYHSVTDFAAVGYTMSGSAISKVYSASNGDATVNNVDTTIQINGFTEVSGYNQVYSGNITYNNGFGIVDGDSTAYPWFVALPSAVIGYVEPDDGYSSLLSAIPVIMIVAILLAVVGVFVSRRE